MMNLNKKSLLALLSASLLLFAFSGCQKEEEPTADEEEVEGEEVMEELEEGDSAETTVDLEVVEGEETLPAAEEPTASESSPYEVVNPEGAHPDVEIKEVEDQEQENATSPPVVDPLEQESFNPDR